MPLREQDYAIWVGDPDTMPTGSSGKVRMVYQPDATGAPMLRSLLDVSWGSGNDIVCREGDEVITVRQAYNRKIPPWEHVFDPRPKRTATERRASYHPVDVLNP